MAVYYVDGTAGNDANDGLTRATAKATLLGSKSLTTGNQWDMVYIRSGVYVQPAILFDNYNFKTVYLSDPFYPGVAILDFNNSITTAALNCYLYFDLNQDDNSFNNIHFRGMADGKYAIGYYAYNSGQKPAATNCVFYNRTASPRGNTFYRRFSGPLLDVRNCTFYNIDYPPQFATFHARNCYVNNCNHNIVNGDYNAQPSNTEANGIDTNTTDPGLKDTSALNFRLDETNTADYQAYMESGEDGGRIGATGNNAILFFNNPPAFKFFLPDPDSAAGNMNITWENEGPTGSNTYTDGTPGDIIDSGGFIQIDLNNYPSATGGRMRSSVLHLGATGSPTFHGTTLQAIEDLASGAGVDIDNTLPQEIEYRSSTSSFLVNDASPAWVAYNKHTYQNDTNVYQQFRITLRTDHTNA